MSTCQSEENYAGVTIQWLYNEIKKRSKLDPFEQQIKNHDATILQAIVRGFLVRRRIKHWHEAATIIQKYWRRHYARHIYAKLMIEKYIMDMLKRFDDAATTIQRFWRGYISRLKIHNEALKNKLQLSVLKDLILCVEHKFKRSVLEKRNTKAIFIRNSHCYEKLGTFMDTLKFKEFNRDSYQRFYSNMKKIERARTYVKANHRKMSLPYGTQCKYNEKCLIHKMDEAVLKANTNLSRRTISSARFSA